MREGTYSLPPRPHRAATLLYGLKPRGAGTGEVESLYSYLLSLAHSHRLAPNIDVGLVLSALGELAVV